MKVRCLGARGSVPVSGPQYARYGGDTSCLEVRSQGGGLLILDAGTGLRRLGGELVREGRREMTLLCTHAHCDHIQGLPFFKPLYDPCATIRLVGCPAEQGDMERLLSQAMRPPFFPVSFADAPATVVYEPWTGDRFEAEGFTLSRIPLSHPDRGAGFRVEEGGSSFVFLTDNELGHRHCGGRRPAEYADFCRGAGLLVHDAQYLPEEYPTHKGWGHSNARDAALLARKAEVGLLGLFHHDQERTDAGEDALVRRCREFLSRSGDPGCIGLAQNWSMDL